MKQLILDTSYITPTGDKDHPVIVRKTFSFFIVTGLATIVPVMCALYKWLTVAPSDRDAIFWPIFGVSCWLSFLGVRRFIKGENLSGDLDTDDFVNLQQFALYIWKERVEMLLACSFLIVLVFLGLNGNINLAILMILFFAVTNCNTFYFYKQIRQAKYLTPDLLKSRITIKFSITPFIRSLEILAIMFAIFTWAVCIYVGIVNSPLMNSDSNLWKWCLAIFSFPIFTIIELYNLNHPIEVTDQEEAKEVNHNIWKYPVSGIVLNVIGLIVLLVAYVL